MASVDKTSKSKNSLTKRSLQRRAASAIKAKFAVCVETGDYADLELRKLYRVKADHKSASQGYVRVLDDSEEDYLYPADWFVPVDLSPMSAKAVREIS